MAQNPMPMVDKGSVPIDSWKNTDQTALWIYLLSVLHIAAQQLRDLVKGRHAAVGHLLYCT